MCMHMYMHLHVCVSVCACVYVTGCVSSHMNTDASAVQKLVLNFKGLEL